jgi:hypothetical protein
MKQKINYVIVELSCILLTTEFRDDFSSRYSFIIIIIPSSNMW